MGTDLLLTAGAYAMPFIIKNAVADPEAAALVENVRDTITPHWHSLFPSEVTINVSGIKLVEVVELKTISDFSTQLDNPLNGAQSVCSLCNKKVAEFWIFYDRDYPWRPADYYFKKGLYDLLGQVIYIVSGELRELVSKHATGLAVGNLEAQWLAYKDTFSRFFLNPEWLADRKPAAWRFMKRIDEELRPKTLN